MQNISNGVVKQNQIPILRSPNPCHFQYKQEGTKRAGLLRHDYSCYSVYLVLELHENAFQLIQPLPSLPSSANAWKMDQS